MKRGGWTLFWIIVIAVLVLGEVAELTHLFTIPLAAAVLSPYALLFSLVLITLLALVGAVFLGIYLSSRIYGSRGFTPFEQEMLRMREEIRELREQLARPEDAPRDPPPSSEGPRR